MQDTREELERRRHDLAERRKEQDARRRARDERKNLYQQEVQLEEEERRLAEEEELPLQEHERLDHLELSLDYEETQAPDSDTPEENDSLPIPAFLIGIGVLVVIFASFSWFDTLGNIFGIAGFVCLALAIWKAFKDEDRSLQNLRIFLGGIAFFWGGALLIALCGALGSISYWSFLSFLGFLGNAILIIAGLVVCIVGFVMAFSRDKHSEVSSQ